jgi:glyoxylase-like metal-dependent hydrolase (beta-lactamase superfamily II)
MMSVADQAAVAAAEWYETITMGEGVTLIHEPWIKPFYRCNIWHVRGRERDLLFDTGLGHFSLIRYVSLVTERAVMCIASHTHFDHIGCHHEFSDRRVHPAEAHILADPRNELTLADRYATDEMFERLPEGWRSGGYRVVPAPAGRTIENGDIVDLGDRAFEVIHTPGHSPGGIGLFERATGVFLSGDVIYDGPLIDDAYHSDRAMYAQSMERLETLPVSVVHGGHFPSFGPQRFREIIVEYLNGIRQAGCHLRR